jgi:hypothetical protein
VDLESDRRRDDQLTPRLHAIADLAAEAELQRVAEPAVIDVVVREVAVGVNAASAVDGEDGGARRIRG